MTEYAYREHASGPLVLIMSTRSSIGLIGMLIYGGAADAIIFGILVFAAAPLDWSGLTGLVVAVGGVATSLYGLYVQDRKTNSRVDELTKEAADAKQHVIDAKAEVRAEAQKEIDRLNAEIFRLRSVQDDIRGNQQVISLAQAEMKADIAKRTFTPDPDHPLPFTIIDPHGGPPHA